LEIAPYKILIIDALSHAALIVDGPSGKILTELPLPQELSLSDLSISPDPLTAYLAFSKNKSSGTFCTLDLKAFSLGPFSPDIPYPSQISPAPDRGIIYLADASGDLYVYDFNKFALINWAKPPGSARCAGLANSGEQVYGLWENTLGGILAVFDRDGRQIAQYIIGGKPTSLTLDQQGRLFIPFTANTFCGEGVLILPSTETDDRPTVVTINCSCCSPVGKAYPLHVAVEPGGTRAYVACEDNATIGIIDVAQGKFCGSIPLGRSISRLALLPDKRFAIASSNMFADLCLIDLVNKRALSFSDTRRELLSPFAVIN